MFVSFLVVASVALANASPTNFIVNGQNAPQGIAPYHAHILIRENTQSQQTRVGSGVLISNLHVLTTATNVRNFQWWNVGLGNIMRQLLEWRETNQALAHPQFNPSTLENNIALLLLPHAVVSSPAIAPVLMPTLAQSHLPLPNEAGRVTGFGFMSTQGNFATDLQVAFQRVVDTNECNAAFPQTQQFSQNVFCGSAEQSNICAGDQGAGYVVDVFFQPVLVGIASITDNSCSGSHPTVYTRVNQYRQWIQGNTGITW